MIPREIRRTRKHGKKIAPILKLNAIEYAFILNKSAIVYCNIDPKKEGLVFYETHEGLSFDIENKKDDNYNLNAKNYRFQSKELTHEFCEVLNLDSEGLHEFKIIGNGTTRFKLELIK
jgi:hypothetical protein